MKTVLSSLLLLPCLAMLSYAEVVPWLVVTSRGGSLPGADATYVVPSGKVFIVEAVQHNSGTMTEGETYRVQTFQTPANFPTQRSVFIDVGAYAPFKVNPLPAPLRLAAGDAVGSNQASGYTYWWGKLVDTGDLFATLDVELDKSETDGDKLKAVANVSSPRPYRLSVESATKLSEFSPDAGATITSTDKSTVKNIAIEMGADKLKFMRAMAVARPADH